MSVKATLYTTLFLICTLILLAFHHANAASHITLTSYDSPQKRSDTYRYNKEKEVRNIAIAQYHHWKGTRYLWGGTTHHGIDCSALMQKIMPAMSGERLPRTTTLQIKKGRHVARSRLKAGDLVFFHTTPGHKHVGLYIGRGQFINSSTKKGVTISSLDNVYWTSHYLTARRLNSISYFYKSNEIHEMLMTNNSTARRNDS